MKTNETLPISFLHCAPICEQTPTWVQCKKTAEIKLSRLPSFGGERGIRWTDYQSISTLDYQQVAFFDFANLGHFLHITVPISSRHEDLLTR